MNRVRTKEELISILKNNLDELRKFGVLRIGIFGSAVRDELKEDSDIDLFIEFERGKLSFENFGQLIEFLEKLLGREVDILTPAGVDSIRVKSVRERIKREILTL